jgi:hypothetical protein
LPSDVQLVVQAPLLHRKGAHCVLAGVGVLQVPVPLHVCARLSVVPKHCAGWHTVLFAYSMHAPAPLHPMPVAPHDDWGWAVQLLCGSRPVATAPHTPSAPCPFAAAVHA